MREKRKLFVSFKKSKLEKTAKENTTDNKPNQPQQTVVKVKMGSYRRLLISFVISAALFITCLVMIKNMAEKEETVTVLVVGSDILSNQKIDAETKSIITKDIPISLVPSGALKEISQIEGMFAVCDMGKGQILTEFFFTNKKDLATELKEPVEVSIGVNSIDQMVGGVIREGDLVNICVIEETSIAGEKLYQSKPLVSNTYVTRTFTTNGASISSEDVEQTAMIVNVLIESSKEDEFNAALSEGTLRVSLVCK